MTAHIWAAPGALQRSSQACEPVESNLTRVRPWLQRAAGECAFPVAGEGAATLSCCQPVERGEYCAGHRRKMFRAADPKEAREVLRLVKALEARRRDGEDGR